MRAKGNQQELPHQCLFAPRLPLSAQCEDRTHKTPVEETLGRGRLAGPVSARDVEVAGGDLELGETDDVLGREDGELEVFAADQAARRGETASKGSGGAR